MWTRQAEGGRRALEEARELQGPDSRVLTVLPVNVHNKVKPTKPRLKIFEGHPGEFVCPCGMA